MNLANPGAFDLTSVGTAPPVFNVNTGWRLTWTGGGSYSDQAKLDTGILSQHGWSWFMRITISNAGSFLIAADEGSGKKLQILSNFNGFTKCLWATAPGLSYGTNTDSIVVGVFGITGGKCYINGVLDADLSNTYDFITNTIRTGDSSGTGNYFIMAALACWNTTLTLAQVQAVTTRMAALP